MVFPFSNQIEYPPFSLVLWRITLQYTPVEAVVCIARLHGDFSSSTKVEGVFDFL
tara:strand:+ start:1360 stop:1524 length:165 start_codon:yes stop_codon:yes gene_type:complete